MTTLSRNNRTLAPRLTRPSVTMQPATLPTLLMLKTSRIWALPRKRSRRIGANVEADDHRVRRPREGDIGFVDAAHRSVKDPDSNLLSTELGQAAGDGL